MYSQIIMLTGAHHVFFLFGDHQDCLQWPNKCLGNPPGSWTFMDHQMDPASRILRDFWSKRAFQSFFIVCIDHFCFIVLYTRDKLELTAWFEVNQTFGFRDMVFLNAAGAIWYPHHFKVKKPFHIYLTYDESIGQLYRVYSIDICFCKMYDDLDWILTCFISDGVPYIFLKIPFTSHLLSEQIDFNIDKRICIFLFEQDKIPWIGSVKLKIHLLNILHICFI